MKQREIKFRALKDDMSNCNFVYGQLVYDAIGNPRITEVDSSGQGLTFHTCIKGTESQYTGLKDTNGKEIYEGDIIKHRQFEQDPTDSMKAKDGTGASVLGTIKFLQGSFCIQTKYGRFGTLYLNDIDGNGQILKCWHGYSGSRDFYEGADSFEIAGNIYENPDPLK